MEEQQVNNMLCRPELELEWHKQQTLLKAKTKKYILGGDW